MIKGNQTQLQQVLDVLNIPATPGEVQTLYLSFDDSYVDLLEELIELQIVNETVNPEVPISVLPLPEGYYFELKPAPKHSVYRSVVRVRKTGFPFSKIVAEEGYQNAEDWDIVANSLSNEVWVWHDRQENR